MVKVALDFFSHFTTINNASEASKRFVNFNEKTQLRGDTPHVRF